MESELPQALVFIPKAAALFLALWWGSWIYLAYTKKAVAVGLFLSATGTIWALALFLCPWPLLIPLDILPVLLLPTMFRVISQYERGVLFRLGQVRQVLEPGPNVVFPVGIDFLRRVDLRTLTIDVPKQEIISKDNVPMTVDAVVYFNVFDPVLAVTKVANYTQSTSLLGQTILRSVLGQHDLDEILSKRQEITEVLRRLLDEPTDPWGIKITAVEIKSIELPEAMKRAMAKQAEAERERRAKVIAAEGESQASEKLLAAATVLSGQPTAIQLRYLQTLVEIAVEKNSTIIFPVPVDTIKALLPKDAGKA